MTFSVNVVYVRSKGIGRVSRQGRPLVVRRNAKRMKVKCGMLFNYFYEVGSERTVGLVVLRLEWSVRVENVRNGKLWFKRKKIRIHDCKS